MAARLLRHALLSAIESEHEDNSDLTIITYTVVSVLLVILAGLMSGLTLGLMSLDMVDLEVFKRSGSPQEKAHAAKIMPVIKHQHFLLVTLVLCNAAATEALPIFIDRLADPITAVLLSVTVVLIFGEIVPQSICSRYGLKVGAYSAWFVRGLMFICAPIAWPIGKLLDWVLGPEQKALFRRAQLKVLVDLHGETAGLGGTLSHDEINIIRGALDLTSKTASGGMTPIDKVFMLSSERCMDEATLQAILDSGHSRIPVYRHDNRTEIIGIILVKELLLINPVDRIKVRSLRMRALPRLSANTPMYDMLKLFETGRSHMAILTKPADGYHPSGVASTDASPRHTPRGDKGPAVQLLAEDGTEMGEEEMMMLDDGEAVGIITIEDVIEELLQEEIVDETDLYVDNMQTSKVNSAMLARSLPPRLRRVLSAGIFTPRVGRLAATPRKVMHDRTKSEPVGRHITEEEEEEEELDYTDYTTATREQHTSSGTTIDLAPLLSGHASSKS